jgi:hypothetical protein
VLGIVILHACRLDGTIMKRTAGVVGPALAQKIYTKQQKTKSNDKNKKSINDNARVFFVN